MNEFQQKVARNLACLRARVHEACVRSNRRDDEVTIVVVTKYLTVEQTCDLVPIGCNAFGESRPHVLCEKALQLPAEVNWHLIGHLQRNKIRRVLPIVSLIHSVDSVRLIESLEQIAQELKSSPAILLEVNVSGERSKDGFGPDGLESAFEALSRCQHLTVQGLMCMGGLNSDVTQIRHEFSRLRSTRDHWQERSGIQLPHLSMGMSSDFEIAIEEGATLIRVGSVLYEGTT
ncbi:MAG TPA: YggS family pyridoxal phosphate-dependent enzyme [Pirellulaceae bacterium]|nr:YggS family pyridoxal phosphate-dependent enzyme [Pirellulaceae bacterium]HMO93861.1 YggS family pyridoxal phosphate-dependent enzyme [Pirellulaceae bacterium]HMP71121.1 YggS family pyridoxal phosphate-dependent enzyme [Pirellulaceae bacterium]